MVAYNEWYLEDAGTTLAEACDYAVNCVGLSLEMFLQFFIASNLAARFEHGEPNVICGHSGIELVLMICEKVGFPISERVLDEDVTEYECSPEYWCGWILAYVQWNSNRSFREILDAVSADSLLQLYPPLHEASEEKAADVILARMTAGRQNNRLQEYRKRLGYTQRELAERAEVNLRTLQQYETGAKRLNRSAAEQLRDLAQVLGCTPDDLIG